MTENEKRKYRLSFCKVCVNRKFSTSDGFKCLLTDNKPNFELTCDYYKPNNTLILNAHEKINREIEKKRYNHNTFFKFSEQKTFYTENKILEEINFPNKMIIKKHVISKFYRFFTPLMLLLMTIYGLQSIFIRNIINNVSIGITIFFSISLLVVLIFEFCFKKNFIDLNKFYLKTKDSMIFWNEIIDINLSIIHKDKTTISKCILGLNSGLTVIIDLTEFSYPYEITKEIIINKTLYNTI